jgi:membrane associated rhomboid family serine protease
MTYVVSGLGGSLSMLTGVTNAVGASAALFGLAGALFVAYKSNEHAFGGKATNAVAFEIMINLLIGLLSPFVNHWFAPAVCADDA